MPSDRLSYLRSDTTITITARRPTTGTTASPFTVLFDGQAAWGDILLTRTGCVEATIDVAAADGSGTATTACKP